MKRLKILNPKNKTRLLPPGLYVREVDVTKIMPRIDLQEFDFNELHKIMLEHGRVFMDMAGELKRMGSKPPKSNQALIHRLYDLNIRINGEILQVMQDSGLIKFHMNEDEILYEIEVLNAS
jgi:hypothetical protein